MFTILSEGMFCPWHISNWSFGLDICKNPKTSPELNMIKKSYIELVCSLYGLWIVKHSLFCNAAK